MELMKQRGIQTSVHYPPVHQFSYYHQDGVGVCLPITEKITTHEVTLPLYPTMEPAAVEFVVDAVSSALRETIKQG
jgi:dTDP-4-amino-4,6-dideoxygalactose transaminase